MLSSKQKILLVKTSQTKTHKTPGQNKQLLHQVKVVETTLTPRNFVDVQFLMADAGDLGR